MENNTPKYYSFQTDSGQDFDVFKLVRWIRAKIPDFSFEKSNALKYMLRIKGDNKKLIDDCKKAINCLQKELAELEAKEVDYVDAERKYGLDNTIVPSHFEDEKLIMVAKHLLK